MTAPNEITPAGFLSATGLAAFAAKTREDWETEQRNAMTSAFTDAETGFGTIKDWIDTLIGLLTEEAQQILTDLFEFFGDIFTGAGSVVTWLENLGSAALSAALSEFDTFISGITSRTAWLATFKTLIDGLLGITNFSTWVSTFKTLIDGLIGITSFSTWVDVFTEVIDFFSGITSRTVWLGVFEDVIDFFSTLIGSLGSGVFALIQEIVEFFDGIFDGAGSVTDWLGGLPGVGDVLDVIGSITGNVVETIAAGITALTAWTQSLPNVGSLISSLLGDYVNPITGTNTTLPDLIAWASRLLTDTSVLPTFNLFGVFPSDLLALIGAGALSDVQPNLVSDATFGSEAAFQAGAGWSWDGTTNVSGSTGGSAKLTCDGGVKYLFSNLIAVAPGQQITVSASTKYTKGAAAAATIICGVRTYDGETVKTTQTLASRVATGTSGDFTTISGTYTIPAATTFVRMVVGVTVGTAGTIVWFDEASLQKAAAMPQTLVSGLTSTLTSLLPAGTFQTLLNTVANTTGATVQQVRDVIEGKLSPTSTLNGSNILAGNISSTFISELLDTWRKTFTAITNGGTPSTNSPEAAANELANLRNNVTANVATIAENSRNLATQTSRINSLNTQVAELVTRQNTNSNQLVDFGKRIVALELKTSTTPNNPITPTPTNPPVAPPVIITAFDDFERVSLGSTWTVNYSISNGSTLGIENSHDAKFSNPAANTTESRVAAIFNGTTGKVSVSEYQKISTVLGSKAGIPASGTQGFNDLIGRAVNATTCMFCRVYPDGRVQFGYRQATWTDQIFGNFTAPTPPTSGTLVEFFCGDKTVNDQTKVYAKIGTATVGPAYMNTAVLASMGKGWGFGMGHGLSVPFPLAISQPAAILNHWSAQEQA